MIILKADRIRYILPALLLTAVFALTGYAAVYEWPNVGLETENTETVLYGAKKEEAVYFNCADLEFRLGLDTGELAGITVLSLPKEEEGSLRLNDAAVEKYERISREELDSLAFIPAKDAATAEFTLLPETADSVKTTLNLNLYENDNLPPVIESGKFSTYKNMTVQGSLSVYDPEGDQIMIKVLEEPEKGAVSFSGSNFTYEPFLDMTGTDAMTFVCVDKQGNYSKKGTLEVNIEKDRASFSYSDMQDNPSHYSAVKLHEKEVLTGEKIGDRYFFFPDRQVTRATFLKALNAALCETDRLEVCVNSGLQNDGDIPNELKSYVKWARDREIITEKIWKPDEVLSRAEAVVLIDRAVDIDNVKSAALPYSDKTDIPSWALQSYMNLQAYKMLDFYDGLMKPAAALQNDHMADLLWQVWKYTDMNRK